MPSYKMLLNILILFLCTSCCACHDECDDDIDTLYLRPIDKATGENAIIKYDTLDGATYLTDEFDNKISATVRERYWYDDPPYLLIGIDDNDNADKILKLWLKEIYIGSFILNTKTAKRNFTACCSYNKITDLKFIEPTIILNKKPQEEKQPFYEIQF